MTSALKVDVFEQASSPINGSFTLATFVSKTAGDSDTQHHLTVLSLANLGGATQIVSFLLAKVIN